MAKRACVHAFVRRMKFHLKISRNSQCIFVVRARTCRKVLRSDSWYCVILYLLFESLFMVAFLWGILFGLYGFDV